MAVFPDLVENRSNEGSWNMAGESDERSTQTLAHGSSDRGAADLGASDRGVSDRGVSDRGVSDRGVSDRGVSNPAVGNPAVSEGMPNGSEGIPGAAGLTHEGSRQVEGAAGHGEFSRRELITGAAAIATSAVVSVAPGAALPADKVPVNARAGGGAQPGADGDRRAAPNSSGFNQPMRFEANVYDCEVIGKIPTDLEGAYVRVGPEWYFPPKHADDGIIDGDGLMSLFCFKDGRVDYRSRWVKTPRWENDRKAHRQLYGKYRNPFTDDPSIQAQTIANPSLRTTANTHTLAFAGNLFAIKEDSLPYRMDPKTLETLGPWDFNGKYASQTFSAHNKIDPVTGELLAYGYEATGLCSPDLWIYTIDKSGRVTSERRLKVPQVSMIHDMAATQKHLIFPCGPYVTSLEWLKAGNLHWGWDETQPSMIGILPRDGGARDLRWFKGPARAMVHILNAKTEGNIVTLYAAFFDSAFFPFFKSVNGRPWDPAGARARIRKYTFNLGSKRDTYEEELLWETPVQDIGRIDTRFMTLPNRYAFTAYNDPARPFDAARAGAPNSGRIMNCYCRFDLETRHIDSYFAGPTHNLGESCFVPRRGTRAVEGDGYLIGVASNLAEMRSELVIADAQHLGDGDVARVILPFRSSSLHGLWIGDDEIDFGA
jgi:carotenoid cleavage dioxygenase-like enzyme